MHARAAALLSHHQSGGIKPVAPRGFTSSAPVDIKLVWLLKHILISVGRLVQGNQALSRLNHLLRPGQWCRRQSLQSLLVCSRSKGKPNHFSCSFQLMEDMHQIVCAPPPCLTHIHSHLYNVVRLWLAAVFGCRNSRASILASWHALSATDQHFGMHTHMDCTHNP